MRTKTISQMRGAVHRWICANKLDIACYNVTQHGRNTWRVTTYKADGDGLTPDTVYKVYRAAGDRPYCVNGITLYKESSL